MADAGGQQVLSPYHAMGCNPVSMVDPLGLQYFAPRENRPNIDIPNAGVAYIEGQRVVLGGTNPFDFDGDDASYKAYHARWVNEQAGEYERASASESGVQQQNESLNGKGVDYTYNGTTISTETKANGLDYNRIVIYETSRKKKGQIKDEVNIGNQVLYNGASEKKHSLFQFMDFADGAITIWEFLAKHANYEWGLTEYKINGRVFSRIVSTADPLSAGGISGTEFSDKNIANLIYWVSIHNHPRGGNGLSSGVNPGDSDDRDTRMIVREKFPHAEMEAYDHSHLKQGRSFIENYRK